MKKFTTLALILLLMLSLTLAGCGGGTDEPAVVDTPVVEDATVTKDDLIDAYNEYATLFNELDAAFTEIGIYETNEELKTNMDKIYDRLGLYPDVIQSDIITDEEIVALYEETKGNIDSLNRAKEAHL